MDIKNKPTNDSRSVQSGSLFAPYGADMFIETGRPNDFWKLRMERNLGVIEIYATLSRSVCPNAIPNKYAAPMERKKLFAILL